MALHMQNGMGKNHLAEHCTLPHIVPNRPMLKYLHVLLLIIIAFTIQTAQTLVLQ